MQEVTVLTIKRAARELGKSRYVVLQQVVRGELSRATVDGSAAVLVDKRFLRAVKEQKKAEAA